MPPLAVRTIGRALGPIFLAVGVALLGDSFVTGGARLYLLVILPVVTGSTPLFGLSVAFLVAGFLFLPFLFAGDDTPEKSGPPLAATGPAATDSEEGSGGLILVGPIPIFFGSWRRNPPIDYRWALIFGVLLAAGALLLLWGFTAF